VLLWAIGAVVMANRGIDLSDESFYLLSYRWWDSTPRSFSGVQYLYGPVFELFGHDIAALRLFRLATVLVAHLWFALAFLRWLDGWRPGALVGDWRRVAVLVIVASGGVTYGWLPLSPGYNDVAALGSLMMLGCVLSAVATARRTGRLPLLPAVALGPLAVALILAKWASAGVILVFLVVVGIVAARSLGARGLIRFSVVGAAATVVSLVGLGFLVGGYGQVLPQVLEVNRLVASDTNSPLSLLGMYAESGLELLARSMLIVGLAVVVLGVAALLRRQNRPRASAVVVVLAPLSALLAVSPGQFGIPGGGSDRISTYTACLVAMVLLVLGAVAFSRDGAEGERVEIPGRAGDVAVIVALVALPAVHALGTGNSLYFLAVNQFACWTALLVAAAVVVRPDRRSLVISAAGCAVVVAATTGFSGLVLDPYRTSGLAEAGSRLGGVGPLAALQVSAPEKRELDAVRRVIDGHMGESAPGRSVMAFDERAGLVLLLDGRSVGEAWYSRLAPDRSAAGIEDACKDGPPWGDQPPVLIFDRPVLRSDRQALASCELDLDADFTVTLVDEFEPALSIYLPRGSVRDE